MANEVLTEMGDEVATESIEIRLQRKPAAAAAASRAEQDLHTDEVPITVAPKAALPVSAPPTPPVPTPAPKSNPWPRELGIAASAADSWPKDLAIATSAAEQGLVFKLDGFQGTSPVYTLQGLIAGLNKTAPAPTPVVAPVTASAPLPPAAALPALAVAPVQQAGGVENPRTITPSVIVRPPIAPPANAPAPSSAQAPSNAPIIASKAFIAQASVVASAASVPITAPPRLVKVEVVTLPGVPASVVPDVSKTSPAKTLPPTPSPSPAVPTTTLPAQIVATAIPAPLPRTTLPAETLPPTATSPLQPPPASTLAAKTLIDPTKAYVQAGPAEKTSPIDAVANAPSSFGPSTVSPGGARDSKRRAQAEIPTSAVPISPAPPKVNETAAALAADVTAPTRKADVTGPRAPDLTIPAPTPSRSELAARDLTIPARAAYVPEPPRREAAPRADDVATRDLTQPAQLSLPELLAREKTLPPDRPLEKTLPPKTLVDPPKALVPGSESVEVNTGPVVVAFDETGKLPGDFETTGPVVLEAVPLTGPVQVPQGREIYFFFKRLDRRLGRFVRALGQGALRFSKKLLGHLGPAGTEIKGVLEQWPQWPLAARVVILGCLCVVGAMVFGVVASPLAGALADRPNGDELVAAYPYGYQGQRGLGGRGDAPPALDVKFSFMGERPCGRGTSELCLQYRYEGRNGFSGYQLMHKIGSQWERFGLEGSPFAIARH